MGVQITKRNVEMFRRAKHGERLVDIANDYGLTSARVGTICRNLEWTLENPWQNQERTNALLEVLGEDPTCIPEKTFASPREWMDAHERSLKQRRRDAL